MSLAEFITDNMELILMEWETFAESILPAGASMTSLVLRDHAPQILDAVVKDITTAQTRRRRPRSQKGGHPGCQAPPQRLLRRMPSCGLRAAATSINLWPSIAHYAPAFSGSGSMPVRSTKRVGKK
jgi:hypothetical protein